jgi:signal transduction histidine kinase/ligand-binding sensor domain-containing protein
MTLQNLWVKNWLTSFFLFFHLLVYTQPGQVMEINLLGQAEGLGETNNYFCFKDSEGIIWISSLTGVYLFDGSTVNRFPHRFPGQIVNGYFLEDSESNIWFSTTEALNCYDRIADTVRTYSDLQGGLSQYFTFSIDARDQLWFSLNDSIFYQNLSTGARKFFSLSVEGTQRLEANYDSIGNIKYIGCYSKNNTYPGVELLEIKNDQVIKRTRLFDGENGPIIYPQDIFYLGENEVLACSGRGLSWYNIATTEYFNFELHSANNNEIFHSIEKLDSSRLIVGTYSGKLYIFDISHKRFSSPLSISYSNNVLKSPIAALYKDPDGGLWLTLKELGLGFFHTELNKFKYFPKKLKTRHFESGINPNSMLYFNNQIWMASNRHGIVVLDTSLNILEHWHRDNSRVPGNTSMQMIHDKFNNLLWVLSPSKSYVLDQSGNIVDKLRDKDISPLSIIQLNNGNILYGDLRSGSLIKAVFENGSYKHGPVREFNGDQVFTSLFSLNNGDVMGASNLASLSIMDPNENFKMKLQLSLSGLLNCILETENNTILLGTDNGIKLLDLEAKTINSIDLPCLKNLDIRGMIPDVNSNVWISTNNGLFNVNLDKLGCTPYLMSYGLSEVQFNKHSVLQMPDGSILLGSMNGLTKFNSQALHDSIYLSPVQITSTLVNDLETEKLGYEFESNMAGENYKLKFRDNTISFSFSSLDYRGIGQAEYEYRLIPEETDWIQNGNKGFARYANLDPGQYTFEVRNVGESPQNIRMHGPTRVFHITIIPPFYQRPWFVLLAISVAFTFVYWVIDSYQRRKRRIIRLQYEKRLALETQRLRIATDLHDDLGSGLSALALRAKVLTTKIEENQQKEELEQLADNAYNLTQQVRETIWTVNSKNDSLDKLVTRIHQYTMEYFAHSVIDCKITLPTIETDQEIEGLHRRNIYLACKEAIHNIQKHAEATQVLMIISYTDRKILQISITDNGKGFQTASESISGMGLRSMKMRMETIGGHFEINSDDQGTQITLSYPLLQT